MYNLLKTLDDELREIENQKQEIKSEITVIENKVQDDRDISDAEVKSYAERFSESDIETKKKIAKLFIDKIVLTDDDLQIFYFV